LPTKTVTFVRLSVFGATGATGAEVVRQALARQHEVVALVRSPDLVLRRHDKLAVHKGLPISAADVEGVVRGADAVVHCLGIGGRGDGKPTTLVSDSVKTVLAAMKKHGVRRIVCMSNIGAGGSGTRFANRIVIPIFLRWLRPIIDDKDRMEAALFDSGVEWVSVRLPSIIEGPERPVRVSQDGRGLSLRITAASAAAFLLGQAERPRLAETTPSISN
jgi:uncharacterized protein YbjT (DUF2867 family)